MRDPQTEPSPAQRPPPASDPAASSAAQQKLRQLHVLAPPLRSSEMEAPLVCLDEEFEDVRSYSEDREDKSRGLYMTSSRHAEDASLSELENFSSEIISFKSMEDLVNEFDEKLNVCFRNYNTKTENLAPVRNQLQIQEEEERLRDEE
ncbi:fasciculation and elongation protein zeta-1 isoform X7 [Spea bombifrons]|nr:fasciculation and elongation protein zeta-1 isoform X7 [Spea bombifrons]XP_053308105.1 fasciculation and elongation protein zeta-1 isoform X7 [Spea bombifrons]